MTTKQAKPFTYRFLDDGPNVRLELTNATMDALKGVEILTVFLKDQESQGAGPSQAHIRFEAIERILPEEKAILSHKTWINGMAASHDRDQIERLRVVNGEASPYVLDISWQDPEGKTRFQRIPVGH